MRVCVGAVVFILVMRARLAVLAPHITHTPPFTRCFFSALAERMSLCVAKSAGNPYGAVRWQNSITDKKNASVLWWCVALAAMIMRLASELNAHAHRRQLLKQNAARKGCACT
jgi:hypothetical protein